MHKIVKISADGASRNKLRRYLQILELRHRRRQQPELQLARQRQVAVQPPLLPRDLFVQTRIFKRDGYLRRQSRDRPLMVFREKSPPRMLQVKHADDLVLVNERHRELRLGLRIRHHIARIFTHVRHQHRHLLGRRRSHQALPERNVVLEMNTFLEPQRETMREFLPAFVEQQDAEHLVIDDPVQQFRDPLQKLIKIQNRRQLARDLIQQQERASLPRGARIELRILDPDGHARADQRQQPPMLIREVARLPCLDINHPDQPVLDDQRHCQLRAHVRNGLDIVVFLGDVVHQNRLPQLRSPPRHSLADLDPHALRIFPRISRLKAEPQLLRFLVQQQDRKNFVVDDLAYQFRDPAQGGIKVERGIDHVGHFQQQRLNFQLALRLGCSGMHCNYDSSRRPGAY